MFSDRGLSGKSRQSTSWCRLPAACCPGFCAARRPRSAAALPPTHERPRGSPDSTQRQDLAQATERQPVAHPAEHHEGDDVAGQAGPVQHTATALVKLPPAVAGSGSDDSCGRSPPASPSRPQTRRTHSSSGQPSHPRTVPTLRDQPWSGAARGARADRSGPGASQAPPPTIALECNGALVNMHVSLNIYR